MYEWWDRYFAPIDSWTTILYFIFVVFAIITILIITKGD